MKGPSDPRRVFRRASHEALRAYFDHHHIDSGIDWKHEDLKDIMWVNQDEIPDNGKDDDNNGYIDDIHGWNFIGGEDGRGQSIFAVVHEINSFVVRADLLDAYDRAETLFGHDPHAVIHIAQQLWHEIGAAGPVEREIVFADMGNGALLNRLPCLPPNEFCRTGPDHIRKMRDALSP